MGATLSLSPTAASTPRASTGAAKTNLAKRRGFPISFNMGIERADGNFHTIPKPAAQPYAKFVR